MRFREIFTEGIGETQDVLAISRAAIDYIIMNKERFLNPVYPAPDPARTIHIPPSNVIDLKDIPGLPKPSTKAGETLINATRIKIVSPAILDKNTPAGMTTHGDAAPYYTDPKGGYVQNRSPSADARDSRHPDSAIDDIISHRAETGNKLDIRINSNLLDVNNEKQLQSTFTHELSHHLDTIKGMNHTQDYDDAMRRINDQERLDRHKAQLELKAKGEPFNPDFILLPDEEKRIIGRLRKPVLQRPASGSQGYYSNRTELNARLMQTAESLADRPAELVEWVKQGRLTLDTVLKDILSHHNIPQAFVKFASEAEFNASLKQTITPEQWKEALKNPEFQQLYKRIYKFISDESQMGGVLAQAQQDGFKTWVTNTKLKQSFIGRFKQAVIDGVQVVRNAAKNLVRKYVMTEQLLNKIILSKAPQWVAKAGVKSIPFVGLLFGIGFAIPRLIDGDTPGAGLEVASSVGSLFTAIPATAYMIARDIYGDAYIDEDGNKAIFEYDMKEDPSGTQTRVKELADQIAELLKTKVTANSPKYPQAFQNTAGGAAVGNPKITQQAKRT